MGELQSKENLGDETLAVREWGDMSDLALDKWNSLESWKMFLPPYIILYLRITFAVWGMQTEE